MESPKPKIPSEMLMQNKFDRAISEFGAKIGGGTLACGLVSFVLFGRAPMLRVAFTTFGSGFGAGWAYKVVNEEFEKDKKK